MTDITANIFRVTENIKRLEQLWQRPAQSVKLLAVSKGQSTQALTTAFQSGLRDFGENYWQEMEGKIAQLSHLPITWHFIGTVQGNKAAAIAQHCSWVHTVDREKIANKLSEARGHELPDLNICVQVNLQGELGKGGVSPHDLPDLLCRINDLPGLRLRGLMAIPKPEKNEDQQYHIFQQLTLLKEKMNQQLDLKMDTLSMGMSDDLAAAIHAGSTIVRIGKAIFGARA